MERGQHERMFTEQYVEHEKQIEELRTRVRESGRWLVEHENQAAEREKEFQQRLAECERASKQQCIDREQQLEKDSTRANAVPLDAGGVRAEVR